VTRYASQTGHYVERKFGWDCHGLPVEYEIDKKFNIKSKEDLEKVKAFFLKKTNNWNNLLFLDGYSQLQ
jgi:isoleucyl-tRNA synthetase